jgi:HD-GYP domain-containing protein (c-di-GMP phosphodiesterase class II)
MTRSGSSRSSGGHGEYRELPLYIMRINERYDFDIYLRIKADYRLFAAGGALFTEQHNLLLKSGNTKLYVRKDDWDKVEECKTRYSSSILTDPAVSTHDKADIAFVASMKSIRDVFKSTEPRTIKNVEENAQEMVKLLLAEEQVVSNLIWIESHDHYTYQHSVRVGIYSKALMLKLMGSRLTKEEMALMSMGFFLHDIGMAQIPMEILDKKTPLTIEEWKLIKMHPQLGYDRLLDAGYLKPEAAAIALLHHERHDGTGYPLQRVGEGISIYAKICALVDTFESLTAARPYRRRKDPFTALKIMQNEMIREFGPELFKEFIMLLGPKG